MEEVEKEEVEVKKKKREVKVNMRERKSEGGEGLVRRVGGRWWEGEKGKFSHHRDISCCVVTYRPLHGRPARGLAGLGSAQGSSAPARLPCALVSRLSQLLACTQTHRSR